MPEQNPIQKYGTPYAKTAPAVLGDQHSYLMQKVGNFMESKDGDKSLLIIGHATEVLPYTFHIEQTGRMIGDGKLVLMDYTDKMIDDAVSFLEKIGFYETTGMKKGDVRPEGNVNTKELQAKTVTFKKSDLRDYKLPFASESFDCVDANLAIHHAIPYQEDLERVTSEIYRILKPGGMFHYGTGNVDMRYASKKIQRFAIDTFDHFDKQVLVIDERMKEKEGDITKYVKRFVTEPGKLILTEFKEDKLENAIDLYIDKHGNMRIPYSIKSKKDAYNFRKELSKNGYKSIIQAENALVLPLIDPLMEEDRKRMIEPVNKYYSKIMARAIKGGYPEAMINGLNEGIFFEAVNAARGIAEYYTSEENIVMALEKAGFKDINSNRKKISAPFYNITSVKEDDHFKGRHSI